MFFKLPICVLFVVWCSSFLTTGAQRNVTTWLESPKITNFGVWDSPKFCPEGTYINGFQIKLESDQGALKDDTAVNCFRFSCISRNGGSVTTVKGEEGIYGAWLVWYECPFPSLANGFELRSEGLTLDITAANNLALYCDGSRMEGNGHGWGQWTGALRCPSGQHLCGFKTQVAWEKPSAIDDTALNNIDMACCT